jgi:hypothetical protein
VGAPVLAFWQTFAVMIVVRYLLKGQVSRKTMDEQEAERTADKNRLWLDKWKRAFETNIINAFGAAIMWGIFWLLAGVI